MEPLFQNILVPTDFSESGNNVIKTAIELCKLHKAVLHLLHVAESRYVINAPEPGIALASMVNEIDQEARDQLNNIYESVMRDQQIDVQMHMPEGIPFEEICKAAEEMPKVLIVMGTHGASGVKEFIMGTTAYSVIKNTTKPVLTIPFSFASTEFKNILFPVRPVQGIKAKYEFIRSFFQNRDVSVHIAALCFPGEQEDLLENKNDIFEIITTLKSANISCSKELYECKNFATKVLELSNSMDIDLIAINATIDFKWTQLLAGSYTQQVVNHSKVPVLSFSNGIYEPGQSSKISQLEPGVNPVTMDRR